MQASAAGSLASLLAALPGSALAQSYDVLRAQTRKVGDVIEAPEDALNLLDFEPAARKALPPAHFGYLATGVDADATLRANNEDYAKLHIKVSRLLDARKLDTRLKLFGSEYASPIFLSPVSSQDAFHSDAEIAVARAAGAKNFHMILSTVGNSAIADVSKAHGSPVWLQLYPTDDWNMTMAPRAAALHALLAQSPGVRRLSGDVVQELWDKWVMIASGAMMTTLMRASVGDIMASTDGPALMRQAMAERLGLAVPLIRIAYTQLQAYARQRSG